jgi:branched-chain amino acid transport system ATP-binding protein
MSDKILEIKDAHVKYGNIEALKGVNVSIDYGEIVCLIGANGAGKSTLLKTITGLEPLAAGIVNFEGRPIRITGQEGGRNLPTEKIIALGISMAPEGRGIFPEMTVLENLEMGAYLLKNRAEKKRRIDQKLSMFEILGERRKQLAGSLSGGEQQMLSIARALMNNPKLLLLDEPALGLAPIIIQNIFDTITSINRDNGVTIFLVEQNAKMAMNISHRGYVMETGKIIMEDFSRNLLVDPKVKAAYLGE